MYRQKKSTNEQERKRGRPSGKNRVPLSLEERRARNAQYERERRNETAAAMAELAEAAGCDPSIKNTELLRTVLGKIICANESTHTKQENVNFLTSTNNKLRAQISQLQKELTTMPGVDIWDHQDLLAPESDSEEESEPLKKKIKSDPEVELLSVSPSISPSESVESASTSEATNNFDDIDALLGPLTDEDNTLLLQMMQEIDYT